MKNVSKNKFLLCFRPVVDMDSCLVLDSDGNGSRKSTTRAPSVKYISDHKDCSKSSSKIKFSQSMRRERNSLSQNEFDRQLLKSFSVGQIQEIETNPVSSSSCCSVPESKISSKPNKKSHMGSTSYCSSSYYAISLLLMNLAVTILWGKVCAILFTSILFYFLPQQTNFRPPENVKEKMIKGARRESNDSYKKRIILEGLLERNHHKESPSNF